MLPSVHGYFWCWLLHLWPPLFLISQSKEALGPVGTGAVGGTSGLLPVALRVSPCSPQGGMNLRTGESEGREALRPIS